MYDIYRSCSAICFFGTPHQGANAATYGEMIGRVVGALPLSPSIYKEVLYSLKPNGEKISSVVGRFNDVLDRKIPEKENILIYSFQEGKPLAGLAGFDGKVVPDPSSYFNRKSIENVSHIMANHMDMCRFKGKTDPGFVSFSAALSRYLQRICDQETSLFNESAGTARAWNATMLTDLSDILDFGHRIDRQQQLANLHAREATFDWVWESNFGAWLKTESPLFWISGNPASGKSTLINYLANAHQTKALLGEGVDGKWTCINHFFDFRAGNGIANNFEGLLRSLPFQFLDELPNFVFAGTPLQKLGSPNRDSKK